MILVSALLLLAAQQTSQGVVPLGSYEVNPAIQSYVHRYTECIEGYVRARAAQPASTAALRELYDAALPACAEVRRHEYEGAERALRRARQFGNPEDRRRVLADSFAMADQVRNQYGAAVRREIREQQGTDARPEAEAIAAKDRQTPPPLEADRPLGHLNIPDEIAPAIVPYVNCVLASRGVPVRASRDGPVVAAAVPTGGDCARARQEAARRAEAMLVSQHRGTPAERAVLIERTLVDVDDFAATTLPPPTGNKE